MPYRVTHCPTVLTALPDGRYLLQYRYESWVQFASRPVMPRVDLEPLVPHLQGLERAPVQWTFDGNQLSTTELRPLGPDGQLAASSLSLETLLDELLAFYEREQDNPALQWNPFEE